ncbi:hypothetical protein D9619_010265 [Psilocybe cf. subviscida]|uniref:Major facilitator superfamily (MFS) profile domain-containing protein n=1 Tax=Psilocybe cf. subviscida TaxID=2480587 RepID=A0A8H5ATK6_9AGAR|nr:hypothetical protein D9619_010265 [Psilocybe cf. subviscida]
MPRFDLQDAPTAVNSARTSLTYLESPLPADLEKENDKASTSTEAADRLVRLTSQGKEEIERYGGDDPHEPEPKSEVNNQPALPLPQPKTDPNMITWDGPNDPENPQSWSIKKKWAITMVCIIMTVNVTFASSAPSGTSHFIVRQFGISDEVSYLITTVFLLGYVVGPLVWGPGSELVGRRPIFIVCMLAYTLFIMGQALAQNIETVLVTRFLSGFFAAAPVTNSGGVIADIWSAEGRGPAISLFTAAVFLGPVLGPIISGYILESYLSWRWVYWVMMIFAGTCTIIMLAFMPETYAPVLLAQRVKKLRKEDPAGSKDLYAEHEKQDWSLRGVLDRTVFRPFMMLAMEPILVLITIYMSIVYGLLYALFQAFPIVFVVRRGFSLSHTGLIFIGVGLGTTLGSYLNYVFSREYPTLIKKWKGFPPPEYRLYGAMLGSPLLVIGCFWLGWTGEYASVPWYVPALSTILIGTGISMIFMSFLSYLVDTYLMYVASAMAANVFVRSAVAAAFPLFTVQMFTNLGVNWACTLLGLLGLIFVPCPFLFYKYGPQIRMHSKFAPCIDLKIAELIKQEELSEKSNAV